MTLLRNTQKSNVSMSIIKLAKNSRGLVGLAHLVIKVRRLRRCAGSQHEREERDRGGV